MWPAAPGRLKFRRQLFTVLAIVWCAGKDGDPETWKDNVTSRGAGF